MVGGEVVSRMLFGGMLHSKAAWKNGFLYVFVVNCNSMLQASAGSGELSGVLEVIPRSNQFQASCVLCIIIFQASCVLCVIICQASYVWCHDKLGSLSPPASKLRPVRRRLRGR